MGVFATISKLFNSYGRGSRQRRLDEELFECAFSGEKNPNLWNDMQALMKRGANVNAVARMGGTVMSCLIKNGQEDLVLKLVDGGADINQPNSKGVTPLMIAGFFARPALIKGLLSRGCKTDLRDHDSNNAATAVIFCPWESKERPLDQKACLQELAVYGVTITPAQLQETYFKQPEVAAAYPEAAGALELEKAAASGDVAKVKAIVDGGVSPDAPAKFKSKTPMTYAAMSGDAPMIRVLKELGADVNLPSPEGQPPLFDAVEQGQRNAVEALFDAGADPKLQTRDGKTLVDVIRKSKDTGMERFVTDLLVAAQISVATLEKVTVMPRLRLKTPST